MTGCFAFASEAASFKRKWQNRAPSKVMGILLPPSFPTGECQNKNVKIACQEQKRKTLGAKTEQQI